MCGDCKQIQHSREFLDAGPLKRCPGGTGINPQSIYQLLMCPMTNQSIHVLILCHFDAYSRFGDVLILCPFLGITVRVTSWTLRALFSHEWSIFVIAIAQAVLQLCANYWLCRIAFSCSGALTRSHTPNACSRNFGVSCDLKYNLGNMRVTQAKNFIRKIMCLMFRWT